jgi:hypothetical protein
MTKKDFFIITSLSLLVCLVAWKNLLFHPTHFLFSPSGDGYKNYYTTCYYVQYDDGLKFTGMNYPYGEHIFYPDAQPIIAWIIKWISSHIYDISIYTIGIVNLLMLLSIIPAIWFLFLIIRKCGVPKAYSFLAAVIIAFMSPQMARIPGGHYGLCYFFAIPLIWYLTLRLFDGKKGLLWGGLLIISIVILSLLHMYFLMTGLLLSFSYLLVHAIYNFKSLKNKWLFYSLRFVLIIAPVILISIFIAITDPVRDRPTDPWGFYYTQANFDSVFVPVYDPFRSVFQYFISFNQTWEGFAYVGLVAGLVLFFTIIKITRYLIKRRPKFIFRPILPSPLFISIWVGVIALLFGCGYPMKTFPVLFDIFPSLKQFRAVGRFAWIFYYIFSVYAAYYIYALYRRISLREKAFAITLCSLLVLFWGIEGYINVKSNTAAMQAYKIDDNPAYYKDYNLILKEAGYLPDDFQAIVSLPFVLIGTDKFVAEPGWISHFEGMHASLQLGLPMASNHSGRSSYDQTRKLSQLLSSGLIEKEVIKDYPSSKPLLMLVGKEGLAPNQDSLTKKGILFFEDDRVRLYRLDLNSLKPTYNNANENFSKRSALFKINTFYLSNKTGAIVYNDFANSKSDNSLFEEGALNLKSGNLEIFKDKIKADSTGQIFEVSTWVYCKTPGGLPELYYNQINTNGEVVDKIYINTKYSNEIYKDWLKVTFEFRLIDTNNIIEVYLVGDNLTVDDFLIRPINTNFLKELIPNNSFVYNNYLVPFKSQE